MQRSPGNFATTSASGISAALMVAPFGGSTSLNDQLLTLLRTTYTPMLSSHSPSDGANASAPLVAATALVHALAAASDSDIPSVNIDQLVPPTVRDAVAAAAPGTPADQLARDLVDAAADADAFSEAVHAAVQGMVATASDVVAMEGRIQFRSAVHERGMWMALAAALDALTSQFAHPAVAVCIAILKANRRFAIGSAKVDESVAAAHASRQRVQAIAQFVRSIPLDRITAAQKIDDLAAVVESIYAQLDKCVTVDEYPMLRAIPLLERVTDMFMDQLRRILAPLQLLDAPYNEFARVTAPLPQLFGLLETHFRSTGARIFDAVRRREAGRPGQLTQVYTPLRDRIVDICRWRDRHHEMETFVALVGGGKVHEDLAAAYRAAAERLGPSLLDTSEAGWDTWKTVIRGRGGYESAAAMVDAAIANKLRMKLSEARSVNELFAVFRRYEAVLFRPEVQLALQQYQHKMVDSVKRSVQLLEDEFVRKYSDSQSAVVAPTLDIPAAAGAVLWCRQLEHQVLLHEKRLDNLFGFGWTRLRDLRHPGDRFWSLTPAFLEFVGTSVDRLSEALKFDVNAHRDAVATALAVVLLERQYAHVQKDWLEEVQAVKAALSTYEYSKFQRSEDRIRFVRRMGDVFDALGLQPKQDDWRKLRERYGQIRRKIQERVEQLVRALDERTQTAVDSWPCVSLDANKKVFISGTVYSVVPARMAGARRAIGASGTVTAGTDDVSGWTVGDLTLVVNFPAELLELQRVMRALVDIDGALLGDLKQLLNLVGASVQLRPLVVMLDEALRTFFGSMDALPPHLRVLLVDDINAVFTLLKGGVSLMWYDELASSERSQPVSRFATDVVDAVQAIVNKSHDLRSTVTKVDTAVAAVSAAPMQPSAVLAAIDAVQKGLDDMSFKTFSNMHHWAVNVDAVVQSSLRARHERLLHQWLRAFQLLESSATASGGIDVGASGAMGDEVDSPSRTATADEKDFDKENEKDVGGVSLLPFKMRLLLSTRGLSLKPTLAEARAHWHRNLHTATAWVGAIKRLEVDRFGAAAASADGDYRSVLASASPDLTAQCYGAIERVCMAVAKFTRRWLSYQALWEADLEALYARLGADVQQWVRCVSDIRAAYTAVDSAERVRRFGPVEVDLDECRRKVASKFETTGKQVLVRFRDMMADRTSELHKELRSERELLERVSLAAFDDAIAFLVRVPHLQARRPEWEATVAAAATAEKLLEKFRRRTTGTTWVGPEQLSSDLASVIQLFERHLEGVRAKDEELRAYVAGEAAALERAHAAYEAEWAADKPVRGDVDAAAAITRLDRFGRTVATLEQREARVVGAEVALNMPDTGDARRLKRYKDELESLRDVWNALAERSGELARMKQTPWAAVVPSRVKSALSQMAEAVRNFPPALRTYEPVQYLSQAVHQYIQTCPLLLELRSEGVQERHWVAIKKALGATWHIRDLTLGDFWQSQPLLPTNEAIYRETVRQALGEQALEQFLRDVKAHWQVAEVELVEYPAARVKLIRGWDDLQGKLSENLASLATMRLSPYFREFADECGVWEDRLGKAKVLFEVWVEVQRRFVYLDNVFTSSGDIKQQLPNETRRFGDVRREIIELMKGVAKVPLVLDVVAIPQLQATLDRLSDALQRVQKALVDYLESQRGAFPRFYFLGDDDLLEVIGSSKTPTATTRHLRKIFAGVATLGFTQGTSPTGLVVDAMGSAEGETIPFPRDAIVPVTTSCHEWLKGVEAGMRDALVRALLEAVVALRAIFAAAAAAATTATAGGDVAAADGVMVDALPAWLAATPAQAAAVATHIVYTEAVEAALRSAHSAASVEGATRALIATTSRTLLMEDAPMQRRKLQHIITLLVHLRDSTRRLVADGVSGVEDFGWTKTLRYEWRLAPGTSAVTKATTAAAQGALQVLCAQTATAYGWEYGGVQDRLVQTPLTDDVFYTLLQSLAFRLGGSPFGPAGTGKTETVKGLAQQLGRLCFVFCCDEAFDYKAMGRIFVGLCNVGAWGCFDEFNRLEERILSAVSQQILVIQDGLKAGAERIHLIDRSVPLDRNVGLFITMNPGYAGRSALPENIKLLFRSVSMSAPDATLIAQVMLFSQGFTHAEALAAKAVPLFALFKDQLSKQPHYDFGLRALKSVLVAAGNMNRAVLSEAGAAGGAAAPTGGRTLESELSTLLGAIAETIQPKLVGADLALFEGLTRDVLRDAVAPVQPGIEAVRAAVVATARERELVPSDGWVEKVLQLRSIAVIHHGVMLVGPPASGKTAAWSTLLVAEERVTGVPCKAHVVDPKGVPKDELYGRLDPTTREWTDGIVTAVLRSIIASTSEQAPDVAAAPAAAADGDTTATTAAAAPAAPTAASAAAALAAATRHWIIFDGDVDPEWVENLNSVLDDNKLLTLPNGERLALPPTVRIVFEVQDLAYATLATVSRCGMVWFPAETVSVPMAVAAYRGRLASFPIRRHRELDDHATFAAAAVAATAGSRSGAARAAGASGPARAGGAGAAGAQSIRDKMLTPADAAGVETQQVVVGVLEAALAPGGYVERAFDIVADEAAFPPAKFIMPFSVPQALFGFTTLLNKAIADLMAHYEAQGLRVDAGDEVVRTYLSRRCVFALAWALGGMLATDARADLAARVATVCGDAPPGNPLDYCSFLSDGGAWVRWADRVPPAEVSAVRAVRGEEVIATVDTVRHEEVVSAFLAAGAPMVLCGPPGSGKTMTLSAVLRAMPSYEAVFLNFSSQTGPEILLKTFEQYCETVRTADGVVLRPIQHSKQLVIFCDEVNLPAPDAYGTQTVIAFMRGIITQGGFFRASDRQWVRVERIQFAGACNPPSDPGRTPLSARFLRHASVLFVDFPTHESLLQIYRTYNDAILRAAPTLAMYAEPLTETQVAVYLANQRKLTPDIEPHYVYSPRELSRWARAIHEALLSHDAMSSTLLDSVWLVQLAVHEALRLFGDRLVRPSEKEWLDGVLDDAFLQAFPTVSRKDLARPILFSTILSPQYNVAERETLRRHLQGKLRNFAEEELNVQLVVFDDALEHITRIHRTLRQPLGHMLLVGVSGAGKTVLSRFVSWLSGLSVFQVKAHRGYTLREFEDDLRTLLRRGGCKGEKLCFIFDESNILDAGFLEYMNALLASGEVPGLFEGDDYTALLSQIKDGAAAQNRPLDARDDAEVYRWFVSEVQNNIHVVFTMNPSTPDFSKRAASSPALFNRCTIDWFGEWDEDALRQVAAEHIASVDLSVAVSEGVFADVAASQSAAVDCLYEVHTRVQAANARLRLADPTRPGTYITPRHYLECISQFKSLMSEKRDQVEEQQRHLTVGLGKLRDTEETVAALRAALEAKDVELAVTERNLDAKMSQMADSKAQASEEEKVTVALQADLEKETAFIEAQGGAARERLARVEPELAASKQAVNSINRQQLREVAGYAKPPPMVVTVMESVMVLMGRPAAQCAWDEAKRYMVKDQFIQDVLQFDSAAIKESARQRVVANYISKPTYTFEVAQQASTAVAPLVKWVKAQVAYAAILAEVEPLEKEIAVLTQRQAETKARLEGAVTRTEELRVALRGYQADFDAMYKQKVALETDKETVKLKLQRSLSLIASLGDEQARWAAAQAGFAAQLRTLVGDCIVSAAFLAYCGFFDEGVRHRLLLSPWADDLTRLGHAPRDAFGVVEFLTRPDERLEWLQHGLPADDLSAENAAILARCERYPLIIDPSGQAIEYVMRRLKSRNVAKTSFLDAGFMKALEAAMRFGQPLVVEDVEGIDPIMNPILNKEVRRQAGRLLVRIGASDVDLSPAFTVYLTTRDASAAFAPDVASRVTMVNFTVTPASLAANALHRLMRHEAPDVDARRSALLGQQGEFKVKMRILQDRLLRAIGESEGNVLDNEALISTLRATKDESAAIEEAIARTDDDMRAVSRVSEQYAPIADACAAAFFLLARLSALDHLYRYSLQFFFEAFEAAFAIPSAVAPAAAAGDDTARLRRIPALIARLFATLYRRTARGLREEHALPFAIRLAQIRLALLPAASGAGVAVGGVPTDELLAFRGVPHSDSTPARAVRASDFPQWLALRDHQAAELIAVSSTRAMGTLPRHMAEHEAAWRDFLAHPEPLAALPSGYATDDDDDGDNDAAVAASLAAAAAGDGDASVSRAPPRLRSALRAYAIVRVLRPDAIAAAARNVVAAVFDADVPGPLAPPTAATTSTPLAARTGLLGRFLDYPEADVATMVAEEASPYVPLFLCAAEGVDAGARVEAAAAAEKGKGVRLVTVAMGAAEGVVDAERALAAAIKHGGWVLLKNVHLAVQLLAPLEKRLHALSVDKGAHPSFRLFLMSAPSTALPPALLQRSLVVYYEAAKGIKPALHRALAAPRDAAAAASASGAKPGAPLAQPAERARLDFLAAWLHAVVVERRHYVPLGFSKRFEVLESDLVFAHAAIDVFVASAANGRANVSPAQLPWDAIRLTLKTAAYGGKMDNDYDRAAFAALVDAYFTPAAYERHYALVTTTADPDASGRDAIPLRIELPLDHTRAAFTALAAELPDDMSPEALQLQRGAGTLVATRAGQQLVADVGRLCDTLTDTAGAGDVDESATAQIPAWARRLVGALPGIRAAADAVAETAKMVSSAYTASAAVAAPYAHRPLQSWLRRELDALCAVAARAARDCGLIASAVDGDVRLTNTLRSVADALSRDAVPASWPGSLADALCVTTTTRPGEFVADIARRLAALRPLAAASATPSAYHTTNVWLGGMVFTQGFLTASRQAAARMMDVALEALTLTVAVGADAGSSGGDGGSSIRVANLIGAGTEADASGTALRLIAGCKLDVPLPLVTFSWSVGQQETVGVRLPIYRNAQRKEIITEATFPTAGAVDLSAWYARAVAIFAWSE